MESLLFKTFTTHPWATNYDYEMSEVGLSIICLAGIGHSYKNEEANKLLTDLNQLFPKDPDYNDSRPIPVHIRHALRHMNVYFERNDIVFVNEHNGKQYKYRIRKNDLVTSTLCLVERLKESNPEWLMPAVISLLNGLQNVHERKPVQDWTPMRIALNITTIYVFTSGEPMFKSAMDCLKEDCTAQEVYRFYSGIDDPRGWSNLFWHEESLFPFEEPNLDPKAIGSVYLDGVRLNNMIILMLAPLISYCLYRVYLKLGGVIPEGIEKIKKKKNQPIWEGEVAKFSAKYHNMKSRKNTYHT